METTVQWVTHYGYAGIFMLLLLGVAILPIPVEWLLAFAGYLVYKGDLHFAPTIVAATLGSVCGITLSYGLGHSVGNYLIQKYGPIIHLTADRVAQVHRWFDRAGKWGLMIGYFVPGVRHLTAFVAGSSKLELSVFALFAYTGGFVWSVTYILIGYFLGEEWSRLPGKFHHYLVIGAGVVVVLLLFYYFLVRQRKHKRKPYFKT
ncbi:DedA family protein [Candidatus Poribacteria bacterium]|nr:DedA family protein [Candidatus Poribacteria bacterium]